MFADFRPKHLTNTDADLGSHIQATSTSDLDTADPTNVDLLDKGPPPGPYG